MTTLTGEELKNDIIERFTTAIENKDIEEAQLALEYALENIGGSLEFIKWVTEPPNVTKMHEDLVSTFGVHPRSMMLRHRVDHRSQRAVMFVKAMLNGVNRTQKFNNAEK